MPRRGGDVPVPFVPLPIRLALFAARLPAFPFAHRRCPFPGPGDVVYLNKRSGVALGSLWSSSGPSRARTSLPPRAKTPSRGPDRWVERVSVQSSDPIHTGGTPHEPASDF